MIGQEVNGIYSHQCYFKEDKMSKYMFFINNFTYLYFLCHVLYYIPSHFQIGCRKCYLCYIIIIQKFEFVLKALFTANPVIQLETLQVMFSIYQPINIINSIKKQLKQASRILIGYYLYENIVFFNIYAILSL